MKKRNIFKKALVFLIAVALLAPLFLIKGASAAETKDYDVNGFTISVPASLEHQQMDMDMKDLQVENLPKEAADSKFSIHTFMRGTKKGLFAFSMDLGEKITYKKLKKELKKTFENQTASFVPGMSASMDAKLKSVKTNLGKGIKISMNVEEGDTKETVEVYVVSKDTKMLVLAGVGIDCKSILKSIK